MAIFVEEIKIKIKINLYNECDSSNVKKRYAFIPYLFFALELSHPLYKFSPISSFLTVERPLLCRCLSIINLGLREWPLLGHYIALIRPCRNHIFGFCRF